jgi:NAD(P)-dependent dehydrogenase (short-subunit alcohol dehydrogenase family)
MGGRLVRPTPSDLEEMGFNIASVAGVVGQAGMADYSAAKAGVIGFSMALAKEVAAHGIHVNCISPGSIETRNISYISQETFDADANRTGLGRWGKSEEVAYMVRFLASDEATT